jgi:8-oxo-dGTP pyrophosphatase MutT (NUDIX family)
MENNILKQFVATRAVIEKDGKILIIKESKEYKGGANIGKYDFPGGKIDVGESIADSLKREVKEEIDLDIDIGNAFYASEWRPVVNGEQIQIIGIFFLCKPLSDVITLSYAHDEYLFVFPEEALKLPLTEEVYNSINQIIKQKLV